MIINDDSNIVSELGASLTDDARVIIYDRHMFIVQATILEIQTTSYDHYLGRGVLTQI